MVFKEVFSNKLSAKVPFSKFVKVVAFYKEEQSLLPENYYVDIRVNYIGEDQFRPTREGCSSK